MPEMTDREVEQLLDAIGLHVPKRLPPECGTEPGYQRHLRLGEETCRPCKDAHAAHHQQPVTPDPSRRRPIEHGTSRGYKQHRYRKEQPCAACTAGEAERQRENTAKQRKEQRRA